MVIPELHSLQGLMLIFFRLHLKTINYVKGVFLAAKLGSKQNTRAQPKCAELE